MTSWLSLQQDATGELHCPQACGDIPCMASCWQVSTEAYESAQGRAKNNAEETVLPEVRQMDRLTTEAEQVDTDCGSDKGHIRRQDKAVMYSAESNKCRGKLVAFLERSGSSP